MGIYPVESYDKELKDDYTFQGLIKGEIKGFFRNIVEFNIERVRGTFVEDKINEAKAELLNDTVSVMKNGKLTEFNINTEKNECMA